MVWENRLSSKEDKSKDKNRIMSLPYVIHIQTMFRRQWGVLPGGEGGCYPAGVFPCKEGVFPAGGGEGEGDSNSITLLPCVLLEVGYTYNPQTTHPEKS